MSRLDAILPDHPVPGRLLNTTLLLAASAVFLCGTVDTPTPVNSRAYIALCSIQVRG